MCLFSSPSAPPPVTLPKTPDAPAPAPQANDPGAMAANMKAKQARLSQSANNKTLVTGGAGLVAPAATTGKTLYGQ